MSLESWAQYAQDARRLDAVRAEEAARTAGMREGVAAMSTHADDLEARLNGQGGMLLHLAGVLRFRRPKLIPIPPEGQVDPATGLGDVGRAIDRGDQEAQRADRRGQAPALLPTLSVTMRSSAVYGVAALVILLLQGLSFARAGEKTNPITVLFLIPLVGFALAYLVLSVGSRTRIAQAAASVPARWGLVVCFLVGPLALLASVASSLSSK